MDTKALAAAKILTTQGKAAFRAGNYDDALHYFQAAYCILPAPILHHNMSMAFLRQERCADAVLQAQTWVDTANQADRQTAADWLATVHQQCVEVDLDSEPHGTAVFIDEGAHLQTGFTSWHGWLMAGEHKVVFNRPHYIAETQRIVVRPDALAPVRVHVTLKLEAIAPATPATAGGTRQPATRQAPLVASPSGSSASSGSEGALRTPPEGRGRVTPAPPAPAQSARKELQPAATWSLTVGAGVGMSAVPGFSALGRGALSVRARFRPGLWGAHLIGELAVAYQQGAALVDGSFVEHELPATVAVGLQWGLPHVLPRVLVGAGGVIAMQTGTPGGAVTGLEPCGGITGGLSVPFTRALSADLSLSGGVLAVRDTAGTIARPALAVTGGLEAVF
jgi:hypothetical protein